MPKFLISKGETSVILPVFIQDSSSSTGAGLGSLDETSSITGGYVKRDGTGVSLSVNQNVTTEGTYEAPTTAAQVRIGTPANMPTGFYELHFHNDLFTTEDWVTIGLSGATNMAPLAIEVQLSNLDVNDGVRAGLTSLPNAAADAPGGLPISDAGGLDLDAKIGALTFTTANKLDCRVDNWAGTAVTISATTAKPEVDMFSVSDDDTSSNNLETMLDGTGGQTLSLGKITVGGSNASGTVELVNSHATGPVININQSGAGTGNGVTVSGAGNSISLSCGAAGFAVQTISASGNHLSTGILGEINAEADTAISDASLATATNLAAVKTDTGNLVTRITSTLFTGITSLADWLGALSGKQSGDSTALSEINATGAGSGTYNSTTDSNEAIADASAALQVDVDDVQSRLPATLVGGRMDSNTSAIANKTEAATDLANSAETIVSCSVDTAVNTHTPTTTEFQSDSVTEATADHYNGRIIIFTGGSLKDQATDIVDYQAVGGIGQFTVTALTEAPADNDTFVIV